MLRLGALAGDDCEGAGYPNRQQAMDRNWALQDDTHTAYKLFPPTLPREQPKRTSRRLDHPTPVDKKIAPVRGIVATLSRACRSMRISPQLYLTGAAVLVSLNGPCAAQPLNAMGAGPSPEVYAAARGGTVVPAGMLEIDGRRMACGRYPTVLDSAEHDFGAAPRGFVVLNPQRFGGLSTPVKLWIFSHECAHQTVGPDEVKADCAAVERGRREGWLTSDGLTKICEFIEPARGDQWHVTGPQRCALMQGCFKR